jgi:hypothetical protein
MFPWRPGRLGRDRTLIEPDSSGEIRLWDLKTDRVRAAVDTTRHKICTEVTNGALSQDGRYLAGHDVVKTKEEKPSPFPIPSRPSGDSVALVNLLDTTTGTLRWVPVGKGPIQCMTFSPDSNRHALLHSMAVAGKSASGGSGGPRPRLSVVRRESIRAGSL